ncbi:hypothetical protein Tco_0196116 [Tanacetum coccineum]
MEPLDAFLMGDEAISTTPIKENKEFIKSSVDDLVPILRESEVTSVSNDLECSMPFDSPPLPCIDVLGEEKIDIDLPFGEHLDTLSTGDRKIDFNPSDIETNDHVPDPKMFNVHLELTTKFLKFEDLYSLDPFKASSLIDESTLLVTPLPDVKQISLREVERFDPFFSLT